MNRKEVLRKKIESFGVQSMTDSELLEFLLSCSRASEKTADILLSSLGSLSSVVEASPELLMKMYGLDISQTTLIKLIPAISREKSASRKSELLINSADKAKKYFSSLCAGFRTERFLAASLTEGLWVSDSYTGSSGALSEISADCSNIIRFAVNSKNKYIIIAHNHPDGPASPSRSDIAATEKIIAALSHLGIDVIDHIIIGRNSAVSLHETFPQISFSNISGYKISQQNKYYK